MISTTHPDVDRVMAETGMDRIQAWRHVQQRQQLVSRQLGELRAMAAACATGVARSIADVIALEHAAGDEAHVTGLPLEHCQQYVRRNAALIRNLNESKE